MPPKRKREARADEDVFLSSPSERARLAVPYTLNVLNGASGHTQAGASSSQPANHSATSSPRTPKKRKTSSPSKKDPDTPVEERRLARLKKACPAAIQERVGRVMTQRFYLVDRERDGDELKETFKVLGSTGNIYTIIIDKIPSCDCPDALKGNHCKHILFVFLKVLAVSPDSKHYYQKALLSTELAEIFNSAPAAPTVVAAERIRQAYASASSPSKPKPSPSVAPAPAPKRVPQEGDDCPICYDAMTVAGEPDPALVFCASCGNALHVECYEKWAKTPNGRTCVCCRAEWPVEGKGKGKERAGDGEGLGEEDGEEFGVVVERGYINVAGLAGISPVRDTSTYYHGPRRAGTRRPYWEEDELYE